MSLIADAFAGRTGMAPHARLAGLLARPVGLAILAFALAILPAAARSQVVEYYHLDALGSVRAVTNQAGQVVERHDYLPFGEECTTTPCAGTLPGTNTFKFTGKERDPESGLDYFGARYYGARLARFTSVDPHFNGSAALLTPQRWNRYSYVSNNPLSRLDPDGRDERHAIGSLGEKLAEWNLQKQGYSIMLSAGRKGVSEAGFDTVARKGAEVLITDNKAFWSRATVSSASALTDHLATNIDAAVGELTATLANKSLSTAEAAAIRSTIDALRTGSYQLVVTGAGGNAVRVSARLAARGVAFKALGKGLGALAFVATEVYFAEDVGGFLGDVELTDEELGLYQRARGGEPIFEREP